VRYESAFSAKPQPKPKMTTSSPAAGARTIWQSTAAVQMPLLAATRSDSSTIAGSADPAAGLKKTVPTDRPNAAPSTTLRCWCERASRVTRPALPRSAVTMTRTRDSRSTSAPATGASREHGQDLRDDD